MSSTPLKPRAGSDATPSAKTNDTQARVLDEIEAIPKASDPSSRQEAFDSARKKFAMYGKQNAHVNHYATDTRQHALDFRSKRSLKRQINPRKGDAKRSQQDVEENEKYTVALQNTLLLQENGELAAQLDDLEYQLDGILVDGRDIDEDRSYAMAKSVVALTQLLKQHQVQTVMKIATNSQELYTRIRSVLLLLGVTEYGALNLSIAVMAVSLTSTVDTDEYFDVPVLRAVVACLETESTRLSKGDAAIHVGVKRAPQQDSNIPQTSVVDAKMPQKKSFLKRKKASASTSSDGSKGVIVSGDADTAVHGRSNLPSHRDEQLQDDLHQLLTGSEAFMADGQVQLSLPDILCNALHNLLQIGGSTAEGTTEGLSNNQLAVRRRYHQHQDLAGSTFSTIISRKKTLAENGGLDVLIKLLQVRFDCMESGITGDLLREQVGHQVSIALQRLRTVLRVLDQISFLSSDVQKKMSTHENVFKIVLTLIERLGRLAWSDRSKTKSTVEPATMLLVMDVVMASLRVLINLSHRNEAAEKHIAAYDGMKILFQTFCTLWSRTSVESTLESTSEDKSTYDALLLLLSAITNCIEYSASNRAQLSTLAVPSLSYRGTSDSSLSACSLLVAFFQSRVESYEHLITMTDAFHELDGEAWVPEDVILGGCTALLLGCLMKDSDQNSAQIIAALPDRSPRLLLRALGAFVALHSQIGALTPEVGQSVLEVERVFKSKIAADTEGGELLPSAQAIALSGRPSTNSSVSRTLTVTMKVMPTQPTASFLDVAEVKDERAVPERRPPVNQSPQRHAEGQRSPPAAAFKVKRFTRVCSNVDDSDDALSDPESRSPPATNRTATVMATPPRMRTAAPTADKRSTTPLRMAAAVTPPRPIRKADLPSSAQRILATPSPSRRTPSIGTGSPFDTPSRTSSIRRLKRTRQLVSDLEAELTKIGSAASSDNINAASADEVEFSLEVDGSSPALSTPSRRTKKTNATPSSDRKKQRFESPPTTHKRKIKSTPSKVGSLTARLDAVFDFDE